MSEARVREEIDTVKTIGGKRSRILALAVSQDAVKDKGPSRLESGESKRWVRRTFDIPLTSAGLAQSLWNGRT